MPRVPDGRTVLTGPEALNSCNGPVKGTTARHLVPFIPDTNTIEALNRQIRKIIKTRGSFPNEDSARKLLYLAITRAQRKWRHTYNWSSALTAFRIHFGDRIPDTV
jgi:transposase-like protein